MTDSTSRLIYPGHDRNPSTISECGNKTEVLRTMLNTFGIGEGIWSSGDLSEALRFCVVTTFVQKKLS